MTMAKEVRDIQALYSKRGTFDANTELIPKKASFYVINFVLENKGIEDIEVMINYSEDTVIVESGETLSLGNIAVYSAKLVNGGTIRMISSYPFDKSYDD